MANNLVSGHNYRAMQLVAEVHQILGELMMGGYDPETGHFERDYICMVLYCRQRLEKAAAEAEKHEEHFK